MSTTSIVIVCVVILLLFAMFRKPASGGIDLDIAAEEDIPRLLMGGHKIAAIKVYRRLHRVDLKEAKEAVERMAAALPRSPKG